MKAYSTILITCVDVFMLSLKCLFYILESIYRLIIPPEEKSVAGEIALITGAGHGIGKELALKYASLGATVVCWDINETSNDQTVNEIKKMGGASAHGYKCDVSSREEVLRVAQKVKDEVGSVTILVNNAGIMPCRPFLEHSAEEIRKMFDINIMAHFWILQAFLPDMLAKNHGHVVALSSMAGLIGLTNLVPYCASKFAVRGMMEALSEELRTATSVGGQTSNVKFTVIYPYMVDTGLCKKPKIKFPSIMYIVPPQEAAGKIIQAQRRNVAEMTIPSHWLAVNYFLRNFNANVPRAIKDFLDSGVEAD